MMGQWPQIEKSMLRREKIIYSGKARRTINNKSNEDIEEKEEKVEIYFSF